MHKFEIREGNTIVTSAGRGGVSITGVVTSTRGPKKCTVLDANGKGWSVPYEMIIACNTAVEKVEVLKAVAGDTVLTKDGEKWKIAKVNTSRYTATRVRDGQSFYVPFRNVVEILDVKKSQREAQKAFLMGKGFTIEDVAEFEKLFGN